MNTGYKRPPWAPANRMTVKMGKEVREIDVELSDQWPDVKVMACDAMGVNDKDVKMTISFEMPGDKAGRGGAVRPAQVGDFNVWDGELRLVKHNPWSLLLGVNRIWLTDVH